MSKCMKCGGKGGFYDEAEGTEERCFDCLGTGKECTGCFQADVNPDGSGGEFITRDDCPVHNPAKETKPPSPPYQESQDESLEDKLSRGKELFEEILEEFDSSRGYDEAYLELLKVLDRHASAVADAKTKKVNRLTVVDHRKGGSGVIFENYEVKVELDYQDKGKTLKVFIEDRA